MTKRKQAEMLQAADKPQNKKGTISVALGRPQNAIRTTEQGQGAPGTLQSLIAMLLRVLEEEAAEHMDRKPLRCSERGNNLQV